MKLNNENIRKVIEAQYCDPDFSISVLADCFQVTPANMSYHVKEMLDINFIEYIWQLRLKRAQKLLTDSDLSIDEISIKVGYLNTSSFRRKFKQDTGITPSQYRAEMKIIRCDTAR